MFHSTLASIADMLKGLEKELRRLHRKGLRRSLPETGRTMITGPVIIGKAKDAQLAWGNGTATQTVSRVEQIAPGYKEIAEATADLLRSLKEVQLSKDDQQKVEAEANKVLVEVTKPEPDAGKIKRALLKLKAFLAPIAVGVSKGAGQGAEEWARKAIEQIHTLALPS